MIYYFDIISFFHHIASSSRIIYSANNRPREPHLLLRTNGEAAKMLNGADVFVAGDKLYKLTSCRSKLWFSTSIINNALSCKYFYIIL